MLHLLFGIRPRLLRLVGNGSDGGGDQVCTVGAMMVGNCVRVGGVGIGGDSISTLGRNKIVFGCVGNSGYGGGARMGSMMVGLDENILWPD